MRNARERTLLGPALLQESTSGTPIGDVAQKSGSFAPAALRMTSSLALGMKVRNNHPPMQD